VKKLVKQVGKELQGNEDYGHHLIEPLKSQGVRRMEEFNMVVGVKFMSKPGEQWTIRRDAYQRIRDVFDENGISFAERNVKVEVIGDIPNEDTREAVAGAAQNAIETQIDPALVPVDDTPWARADAQRHIAVSDGAQRRLSNIWPESYETKTAS